MEDPLSTMDDVTPPSSSKRFKKKGGNGKQSQTTVVTRQVFTGDAASEEVSEDDRATEDGTFNAIFDTAEIEERAIVKIRVIRKDPHEGYLGYLEDPSSTMTELQERWGGSFYRLEGVNERGRIVSSKTVKVAGDPTFVSQSAEMQWRRARGLSAKTPEGGATPAAAIDLPAIMSLMQEREAARSKEAEERDERRRRDEREAQERMRTLDREAEAKSKALEEERERRRQKDQDEREERRRKDDQERDERRRADAALAEQRQQQFFAQMLGMVKESSAQALALVTAKSDAKGEGGLMESLKVIAAIKDTFGGDGGGGGSGEKDDIASLVVKHGAEWLSAAGSAIGGAIREVKGGGSEGGAGGAAATRSLGAMPLGSLQPKVELLVEKIAAKGGDPEKVLSKVLDNLIAVSDGKVVPNGKPAGNAEVQSAPVDPASLVGQPFPTETKPVKAPRREAQVGAKVNGTQSVRFP